MHQILQLSYPVLIKNIKYCNSTIKSGTTVPYKTLLGSNFICLGVELMLDSFLGSILGSAFLLTSFKHFKLPAILMHVSG